MASSTARVRGSKAQAALAKIIAVISTVRPRPDLDLGAGRSEAPAQDKDAKPVSRVDLSLRLGLALSPEIGGDGRSGKEDGGGGPTAGSGVVDAPSPGEDSGDASTVEKASVSVSPAVSAAGASSVAPRSSEGECDPEEEESHKGPADGAKESSDITNTPRPTEVVKQEEETKGTELAAKERGDGGEGYLDLLLEAVRQVSGGFSDDGPVLDMEKVNTFPSPPAMAEEERRAARPKRRETAAMSWAPFDLYEDAAPIVRSKRGRSQALPSRYRDSVLEPWRKPPTISRHGRAARPR